MYTIKEVLDEGNPVDQSIVEKIFKISNAGIF